VVSWLAGSLGVLAKQCLLLLVFEVHLILPRSSKIKRARQLPWT
jgi:hypothetical protein